MRGECRAEPHIFTEYGSFCDFWHEFLWEREPKTLQRPTETFWNKGLTQGGTIRNSPRSQLTTSWTSFSAISALSSNLPVDQKPGEIETLLPTGKKKTLYMRDVDIENCKKIQNMKGINVLKIPTDLTLIYT